MINDKPMNNLLAMTFGTVSSTTLVYSLLQTVALAALGAVVGAVVTFFITRWLNKTFK